jgi:hypothetical protein
MYIYIFIFIFNYFNFKLFIFFFYFFLTLQNRPSHRPWILFHLPTPSSAASHSIFFLRQLHRPLPIQPFTPLPHHLSRASLVPVLNHQPITTPFHHHSLTQTPNPSLAHPFTPIITAITHGLNSTQYITTKTQSAIPPPNLSIPPPCSYNILIQLEFQSASPEQKRREKKMKLQSNGKKPCPCTSSLAAAAHGVVRRCPPLAASTVLCCCPDFPIELVLNHFVPHPNLQITITKFKQQLTTKLKTDSKEMPSHATLPPQDADAGSQTATAAVHLFKPAAAIKETEKRTRTGYEEKELQNKMKRKKDAVREKKKK